MKSAATRNVLAVLGAGALIAVLAGGASASSRPAARPSTPRPSPARKRRPRGTVTPGEPTRVDVPKDLGRQVVPPLDKTKGGGEVRPITRAEAKVIAQKLFDDPTLQIDGLSMADWALIEEENHKLTVEASQRGMGKVVKSPNLSDPQKQAAALRAAQLAAASKKPPAVTSKLPPIEVDSPQREPAPQTSAPLAPPTPSNLERARQHAEAVAKHIRTKKDRYDRDLVKQFQADAGLVPDGLYGPVTASALRYFGVKNSPPAVFKGTHKTYVPPQ